MKYICAFDLDGTLLGSDHKVSEANMKAIKALREKGVGILLATGRTELMTRKYVRELKITLPLIANNGALIIDPVTREIIHRNTFDMSTLHRLIQYTTEHEKDFFLYTNEHVYYSANSVKIKVMRFYNSMVPVDEQIDLVELPKTQEEIIRLLPSNGNGTVLKVLISYQVQADYDYLRDFQDLEAISSQADALDITPKGSTKGEALKMASKLLNIGRENIFAFGDNHNDLSMLTFAGHAVVPANAVKPALDIANFVSSSNDESGVAKGIMEYVLPKII